MKMTVSAIIDGTLGTILEKLEKRREELEIRAMIVSAYITVLEIDWIVLSNWGNMLLLKLQLRPRGTTGGKSHII